MTFAKGDLLQFDGVLCVVISTSEDDPDVPEDHLAAWFGDPKGTRASEGGVGRLTPEVFTIPNERVRRYRSHQGHRQPGVRLVSGLRPSRLKLNDRSCTERGALRSQ